MVNFLVISGLITIMASTFTATILQNLKFRGSLAAQSTAELLRYNMLTSLQNEDSWPNTVNDTNNSSLDCLRNGSNCAAGSYPISVIKDAADLPVIDNTVAGEGFTMSGVRCSTFSTTSPDPTCPFHVEISWTPICGASCNPPPTVRLSIVFSYSTASEKGQIFNPSKYNMVIDRSSF